MSRTFGHKTWSVVPACDLKNWNFPLSAMVSRWDDHGKFSIQNSAMSWMNQLWASQAHLNIKLGTLKLFLRRTRIIMGLQILPTCALLSIVSKLCFSQETTYTMTVGKKLFVPSLTVLFHISLRGQSCYLLTIIDVLAIVLLFIELDQSRCHVEGVVSGSHAWRSLSSCCPTMALQISKGSMSVCRNLGKCKKLRYWQQKKITNAIERHFLSKRANEVVRYWHDTFTVRVKLQSLRWILADS